MLVKGTCPVVFDCSTKVVPDNHLLPVDKALLLLASKAMSWGVKKQMEVVGLEYKLHPTAYNCLQLLINHPLPPIILTNPTMVVVLVFSNVHLASVDVYFGYTPCLPHGP